MVNVPKLLSMYVANGLICLAELHEALTNGAQQMKYHGRPYQVSAQSQRPTDPTDENQIVGLDEHEDGPEDLRSAETQQQRPHGVERAHKMRYCYWISCIWISCIRG